MVWETVPPTPHAPLFNVADVRRCPPVPRCLVRYERSGFVTLTMRTQQLPTRLLSVSRSPRLLARSVLSATLLWLRNCVWRPCCHHHHQQHRCQCDQGAIGQMLELRARPSSVLARVDVDTHKGWGGGGENNDHEELICLKGNSRVCKKYWGRKITNIERPLTNSFMSGISSCDVNCEWGDATLWEINDSRDGGKYPWSYQTARQFSFSPSLEYRTMVMVGNVLRTRGGWPWPSLFLTQGFCMRGVSGRKREERFQDKNRIAGRWWWCRRSRSLEGVKAIRIRGKGSRRLKNVILSSD